jgi:hypothetical protein
MTDSLTFSDAVNRIASVSSTISDVLSFSDVINKSLWAQLTETITITENVNRGLISLRNIIQSLLFVDVSSTGQGQQQPPQQIIKPPFSFFVTIQDVLGLNEEVSSHASFLRGIADQISSTDILARAYLSQILLTETVQVADQLARMLSAAFRFIELTETLNVSDNIGRLAKMTASISDNIAMNIAAQATSNIYRTITDTMSVIVEMLEAHIIGPVKQTVVAIAAPQLVSSNEPLIVNARSTSNAAVMITRIDNAANVIVQPLADVQKIAPPSSHTVVGTPVEIAMTTQTNFNAKVRLYYSPEQIRTLGLQPSDLSLYTFSESLQQWRPVASIVDEVEHYLETSEDITHFSKWAIMNKPITIGLFDVVIGMGRVLPSFSRLEIVPQAQILSAVSLINMGDRPSSVVFKYWLMDPQGNTITSGIKSLSVDPIKMQEIPLGFPIATPGKYRVASQIIADGIESEAVTRIYDVGFLDIYGVHTAVIAAIAMIMLGLTYTERRPREPVGRRQRFDYPL